MQRRQQVRAERERVAAAPLDAPLHSLGQVVVARRDGVGDEVVDRRAFIIGGDRAPEEEIGAHTAPPTTDGAGSPAASFSTRIAVALNSAVPDFGSVASIVSRFVST